MEDKRSKNFRVLDLYSRLMEGKCLNKSEEASFYNVDERSIQRDIDDIRSFLCEKGDNRTIEYSRINKGYMVVGDEGSMLSNSEILAVSKILLESRAFTKSEIESILNKLIAGCVPYRNMKMVSDLISNEKFHYVELHNQSAIKDKLWELGTDITAAKVLEIKYTRATDNNDIVKRLVVPVAIMFSDYYFYLNAFILDSREKELKQAFDYPAIYRIDRILSYKDTGMNFKISYKNRFEEGEFRKRSQFMYGGELTKLKFTYKGNSVDAILDRLPTAKIVESEGDVYVIEAEVYGKGILMWLLSQGSKVEILRPGPMRAEMKRILKEMLECY